LSGFVVIALFQAARMRPIALNSSIISCRFAEHPSVLQPGALGAGRVPKLHDSSPAELIPVRQSHRTDPLRFALQATWDNASMRAPGRVFFTCWITFTVFWTPYIVREHFPAIPLAESGTLNVQRFLGYTDDIFPSAPGRAFINNNPGASITGAVPLFVLRPSSPASKPGISASPTPHPRQRRRRVLLAHRPRTPPVLLPARCLPHGCAGHGSRHGRHRCLPLRPPPGLRHHLSQRHSRQPALRAGNTNVLSNRPPQPQHPRLQRRIHGLPDPLGSTRTS